MWMVSKLTAVLDPQRGDNPFSSGMVVMILCMCLCEEIFAGPFGPDEWSIFNLPIRRGAPSPIIPKYRREAQH